MKEQFDNEQFSQFLNEQLQREAEEIEKELEEHPELADLSPDDSVKDRLYAQIEEYETQKALSKLSEKDREALRLGRMLQKEREEDTFCCIFFPIGQHLIHTNKFFYPHLLGMIGNVNC